MSDAVNSAYPGPTLPATDPMASFRGVNTAIVLPTLNEADGVARTLSSLPLDELARSGHRAMPFVIDGGSTDGTVEIVRNLGIPLRAQGTRGKGAAIREALAWLRSEGIRYAIVLDADCTYPGEAIGPALALLASGSDLVIGIRRPLVTPLAGARDAVHRVGNAALNYLAARVSGEPILDLCSGFWGIDLHSSLDRDLVATGFDIEAELFLSAYRTGRTVTQIPIQYRKRVGEAKLRTFRDGARIFLTVLRCGRRPWTPSGLPARDSTALFRETLSICFANGAEHLTVVSDPTRRSEAEELISYFRGTGIVPHLSIIPPPAASERPTPPSPPGRLGPSPRAIVLLPDTRRMIYLGDPGPRFPRSWPNDGMSWTPPRSVRSSWVREFPAVRGRPLAWLQELGGKLDRSRDRRELSMLGANDFDADLTIWYDRTDERHSSVPTLYLFARP
ncbi:MAG: glycosyltransferase family 2 protein [Thermoplasmata archaeon]|nr:glycosyltransferase family 2 protein [Thermoplasmata archaeon]